MRRTLLGLACMAGALGFSSLAQAQHLSVKAPPESDSGVTFSVTPYLWLTSLSGTVANTPPALTPAPGHEFDASFLDIAPSLEGAFMMKAELGFGNRWGMVGDVAYASIGLDVDPKFTEANISHSEADIESLQSTVALRYRMIDGPAGQLDLVGGARISYAKLKVNLTVLNTTIARDGSDTWVDPIIGIRGRKPLSENWALVGYGDIGGFGVSSDFTGQAMAAFDYGKPGSNWNFTMGYRYYTVDYENLPLKLDLSMYGPILGATYRF